MGLSLMAIAAFLVFAFFVRRPRRVDDSMARAAMRRAVADHWKRLER